MRIGRESPVHVSPVRKEEKLTLECPSRHVSIKILKERIFRNRLEIGNKAEMLGEQVDEGGFSSADIPGNDNIFAAHYNAKTNHVRRSTQVGR